MLHELVAESPAAWTMSGRESREMTRGSLSLKAKLFVLIGFLGLVPVVCVALNSYGLALSGQAGAQMDIAQQGSRYLERINGVYAVVAESRGIYMSPDWPTAETYAKLLLQDLAEIDTTAGLWKARAIESERGRIEELGRGISEFVGFRKELVRLAQAGNIAAARTFGDNDANRKVRSALNVQLGALGKAYVMHVADAAQEVQRIETLNQVILFGLTGLALAAVIAGCMFVLRGFARPLQAIRDTMLRLAGGAVALEVPGIERTDEIG
jgi:methyl-accepting chemotaxis protein